MGETLAERMARKLKTTVLATFLFAMAGSIWDIQTAEETVYHLGTDFYAMTLTSFFYIGLFVLTYGNAVSIIIESFQQKWFERADWLYVLLLGVAGSAIGLLFPFQVFILSGVVVAVLYGVIDKWLLARWQRGKGNQAFFIGSIIAFFLLFGYFLLTSPSLPLLTADEAVETATQDDGTVTDVSPNEAGTWKGEVDGYQVERTTAVEQLEEGLFLVIFTETWQKGTEKGEWMLSYEVALGTVTLHDEEGAMPPYDMLESAK
ncbi:hypothetical protein ACSFXN_07115 [Planococcus sp. 1R117A]|uniref:hypothetical protein n=1 Tax=Planococcus sp. 1R117A TaxID=3447020 RepID=UPI003EDCB1C1